MTEDLLQKKWNYLKDRIDYLNLCPPSEKIRKEIRALKDEASIIRFAIEDLRDNKPRDLVLENLISNRDFYRRLRERYED